MSTPYTIDIRPRRLPVEIRQIEDTFNTHGKNSMKNKINYILALKWSVYCFVLGIKCSVVNDTYDKVEASVPGPKDTPYEDIIFRIAMEFDSHYPFRPPVVKFVTPVYHPNIDRGKFSIFPMKCQWFDCFYYIKILKKHLRWKNMSWCITNATKWII